MDKKLILALLLLPGMAQAVVCKTVGADGVASFAEVPASECPQGSRILDYSRPAPLVEQARSVGTDVSGRQVAFDGYRSIRIVSPEADGVVRSNDGSLPVLVELDPGLLQSHFITAYVDGKTFRGGYGSSEIELKRLDRGAHTLRLKVSDSKGRILIQSDTVSFTVQKIRPRITVNPITGDDYIDQYDPDRVTVRGIYKGPDIDGESVTLWFPARQAGFQSGQVLSDPETIEYWVQTRNGRMRVVETYNWEVKDVPREYLATESSFEARAKRARSTSTHSIDPSLHRAFYSPPPAADYGARGGAISTTPGRTNPAFKPNYTP